MSPFRRIYLAARYSRRLELCGYRRALELHGILVTSTWLNGEHQIDDGGHPIGETGADLVERGGGDRAAELRQHFAVEDLRDVRRSDALVAFTETPRSTSSRGGRHVELGVALGRGIPVIVVGPRENVFCWLEKIEQFDEWGPAFARLTGAG